MRRYLAVPGALLLTAAFVRAAMAAGWDAAGVGVAIVGVAIVLLAAIWNRREVVEWFRDPRGVFAVTTGLSVALIVAVLVMSNIAVWYHPWSIDLTAAGRNQVSEGTRHLLERLQTDVSLQQFGRASDPVVDQLLQGFARTSRRVRIEFIDVDRERERATRAGVLKLGTVVVASGNKFRKVEDVTEQGLVTALLQVTTEEVRTVCFVTGHGEHGLADTGASGLSQLIAALEASNYRTDRISLLEDEIPAACTVVIVAGARQELLPSELERLQGRLMNNGRVALLLDPEPAASFAEWLRPLGIAAGADSILDTSGAGQSVGGGPSTPLALRYADHPVTRGFEIATMYAGVRPLQIDERSKFGTPTALAQTGPRSSLATKGETGPFTLAAVTSISTAAKPALEARLFVAGDSDFVSNGFITRQGNRDFFLRSLAWLMGEADGASVLATDRQNRRIDLTERTRTWMYIVNLAGLPLVPLLAGVFVYFRSRR